MEQQQYIPITREYLESRQVSFGSYDVDLLWQFLEHAQSHISTQAERIKALEREPKAVDVLKRLKDGIDPLVATIIALRSRYTFGTDIWNIHDAKVAALTNVLGRIELELSTLNTINSNTDEKVG